MRSYSKVVTSAIHAFLITFTLIGVGVFAVPSPAALGLVFSPFSGQAPIRTTWWSAPSLDTVWDLLQKNKEKALDYSAKVIQDAKAAYQDVADDIEAFKVHIHESVKTAEHLVASVHEYFPAQGVTKEQFSESLSLEMDRVAQAVMSEFEDLPEDRDERYQHREKMVNFALDQIEIGFVKTCTTLTDMSEEEAKERFMKLRPGAFKAVMIAGNIADRHPVLVEAIVVSAVCILIPEEIIIGPVLRVFGFGVKGPVKGTLAPWLQRRFFGGAVREGSWFALLQRAGMVGVKSWLWRIIAAICAALGVSRVASGSS